MTELARFGQRISEGAVNFRCAACAEVAAVVMALPADMRRRWAGTSEVVRTSSFRSLLSSGEAGQVAARQGAHAVV